MFYAYKYILSEIKRSISSHACKFTDVSRFIGELARNLPLACCDLTSFFFQTVSYGGAHRFKN